MSDSQIGGWLIVLLVIAYAIFRYMKKRNENAKAEQVRVLLRPRIDKYTREGNLSAAKDHYFSSAVEDDTAHGRPLEEIDINRRRAVEFERQGRSLLLRRVLINGDCSAIAGCRKRRVGNCVRCSGDLLPPSPPAEKATAAHLRSPTSTSRMGRRPRAGFLRGERRVHRARARRIWDCG